MIPTKRLNDARPAGEYAPAPASTAPIPGLEYDFEESIGYWMVLASQAFQKVLGDELAPHGLTFRQCQVLGWLVLKGPLPQVELANHMMIEPATLVGVLDRMERENWIARTVSETDRRSKKIQVNPEARAIWKQAIRCARRVRARAVEGLTERQVSELKKTLRVVLGNLS